LARARRDHRLFLLGSALGPAAGNLSSAHSNATRRCSDERWRRLEYIDVGAKQCSSEAAVAASCVYRGAWQIDTTLREV
jgi:hypothetical protein